MAALLSVGAVAQGTAQTSSPSAGNRPSSSTLTAADRTLIKKATEGGQPEVALGHLAAQKASSDEIKKFGQRMVDDQQDQRSVEAAGKKQRREFAANMER
jgi:predicted outer membrane protein